MTLAGEPASTLKNAVLLIVSAAALLWPLWFNGYPIIFYDTAHYISAGQQALRATGIEVLSAEGPAGQDGNGARPFKAEDGVPDSRSVYYGLFAQLMNIFFGFPSIVIVQATVTVLAISRALDHLEVRAVLPKALIFATLSACTQLPFFVSLVMPDIFGTLMLLALAVLAAFYPKLKRWEAVAWLVLALSGMLFHKAFLLMAPLVIIAAWVFRAVAPPASKAVMPMLSVVGVGLGGTLLFGFVVEQGLNRPVVHVPFVLARMIEDRTAEKLLIETCPESGLRTCVFVPELPMSENEFLWGKTKNYVLGEASSGFSGLPLDDRLAISDEQMQIVGQVLRRYPVEQALRSIDNLVKSLLTVNLMRFQPPDEPLKELATKEVFYNISVGIMPKVMPRFAESKLWHGDFPLSALSWIGAASYLPSLVLLALLVLGHLVGRDLGSADLVRFAAVLLIGLLVNAAISGVLSGVSGRYQARFAALPVLAVLAFLAARWRAGAGSERRDGPATKPARASSN